MSRSHLTLRADSFAKKEKRGYVSFSLNHANSMLTLTIAIDAIVVNAPTKRSKASVAHEGDWITSQIVRTIKTIAFTRKTHVHFVFMFVSSKKE